MISSPSSNHRRHKHWSPQPTPKKRAFGTALPTNSPFPRQRQQQQPKSAKKQLQWTDKKQSASTTAISDVQSSQRKQRSKRKHRNHQSRTGNGSILSTPYGAKTPITGREGTPSVKWSIPEASTRTTLKRSTKKATTPGRVNLFNDFNSPAVPSNVATPGVIRKYDSSHAQKLTYANIAASSPKFGTPTESPVTADADQSYLPTTPQVTELLSVNNPVAASISPSASSVKSNSTTGTSLAVTAMTTDVPETIAPAEYVIEFPPGPLHLKLDSVVYTLGKPMGCCVAKILPEFDSNLTCVRMGSAGERSNAGAAADMIQVNDLIVSINGTNVLSRKFDVITDLLHKLDGSHKTIVLRSIEKVWTSQFERKTMRNLRSGRRVATALSNDQMEHNLHSWVETPTKVEVGRRGNRRSNVATGDKLESISETPTSNNKVHTPKGDADPEVSTDLFSPSNVKKVVSQRSGEIELLLSATPKSSCNKAEIVVGTSEKNYITFADENQGSAVKSSKNSPINQISKALVGDSGSGKEFEQSLRMKKNVLKELNGVCLELGERYFSGEDSPDPDQEVISLEQRVEENTPASIAQTQLEDTDEKVNMLEERVRELTDALASAEDEAREREDELEDQLQQLQSQLSSNNDKSHAEEIRRLEEEKAQAINEVQQQLEKERAFFQERVAKGKRSKQELIGKLGATQSELEKNKALFANLEKKAMSKKEMKAKIKSSSALIQSLQAEKGQLAKEVKSLQKHLSDRDSSEKVKEAELEQKTSELEKMVEQVANLESERDAANEEKQAELESLSSSLTEKAVELEKMVEEVTNLKHHLSLSEKKGSADRVALKANKSKLVEECEQLKAELAESNRVKEDLNAKIDEHETELSRRQNLLDDLKSRNYSLQEMIDDLNETLERSGKDASEQVGFIERKLQTMKQELDDSRSISIQRQDELRQLGEENQTITKQLSKALEELEENRHLLLENDKLSSEHEFLDNRVGKLTESLEKAEHDAREREEFLEKKLEIVKMELDETRSLSNMRHDEIHRLKKEKQNILENAETNYTEFNEQLSAKEEQLSLVRKNTEKDLLALKDELEREQTLKKGLNQKLELIKVDHMASLSRRQELLDDMEKHNSLLKERVLELTDCLAAAEDDARERQDALEEKLEQMKMEVEEAKKSCSRLSLSHAEELKRVEAEKVDALQCMREQMEAECALLKECVVKEEKSKAEVMTELDSLGKHNDLLKQRVTELTDCLAAAEDDAREREDALEEKELQLRGELEEAKVDMKRIQAEYEAVLHDMRREMQVESERFNKRLEIETMSKEKVAAELDTTKHKLVVSEASYAKLECRLQDVQKAMDMEINKLASTLEKSNDDFRQQEDILQGELSKLALKVDEAEVAETQLHEAHKNEIKLIEEEKRAILNENTRFQEHLEGLMNQLELGKNTRNDLESRVESLDKAKAFHEKSLSRRQELLDDMEERNSSLKQRVDELVNCLAKTEDDAREKEDALNERLLQLGSEFETAKSNFNEENVSHIEVVDRLEDEKKSLVSQVSDLSQEKSQLLCQISALRSGNVELESLLQQVKDSNAASNDEVKELSEKLSSANLDLSRNQTLCEDLKSKLETAERLLDESDAEINTLSYDCDCLEKQVENLNAELETQQQAIATYESQFHSQHNEISLGRSEMESISEDLESQMAKVLLLEDEKSDLSLKIESLTGSLKTVEAEKLQLMSERDALKSISDERHTLLRQLEGNTEIRQSELLDSLAAKEFEISSLKSQRGDLERSLEDLDYRFKQLQTQCEKESKSFENRQDQLLNEISTVNAQNGSYVAQITSLEANMKRIKAELKKEKETHEKTERQLIMDIRNSQNSMSSAKIKQSHVENELQSVKSQLSIRESETSKLIEEKERLETEMRNTLLKADDESKAFAVCRKELDDNVNKLQSDFEKERALCADLTSRLETLNLATNAKQEEIDSLKKEISATNESLRQLQLEGEISKSSFKSQLNDIRSQFEDERQSLKDSISRSEAAVLESQQNFLAEKTSSVGIEAHLNSQLEIIKAELSNAKKAEDDLRERLFDANALLKDKNYEIEELNGDISSEKEGRRQELFETKSLYEKKIQELTTASLDIEAEKSILEAKVERLTQDIAASKARTNELEQLLQRQNEELLKLTGDMSSAKATHETTLSEMEKNYTWNVEELKQLHDTERSELLQQMSEISDELQICEGKLEAQLATQENDKVLLENDKDMIDQLRVQLEEGINLNESLSAQLKGKDQLIEVLRRDLKLSGESLTAVDMKYKAKIDEMKSSYNAEKLHLMEEIEKFSTELDWSLDQIDKRQSIIDSQRLSLNDENNQLIRELSVANDTEMVLRKMLHEAHMEVQQLSIDCNSTRSEIVTALNEARSASEESIQQTAQVIKVAASKWATEKASYEDKIKALQGNISEFSNRDEQFSSQIEELQASLETRDRTVAELSSKLAEITASLEASVGTEVANELASRVDELRTALESRDRHIKELSSQLISKDEQICAANEETQHVSENLECAMSQLDEMIGTNEDLQEEVCKLENLQKQIQSLFATETGDLQTSLDSESNKLVSVTSELDTVILANKELQCKLDKVQSEQNVSFDKFNSEKESLQSRIVSVTSELDTMMLANKKLESELSKLQNEQSLCQDKFESESESLQNRIDTLSRDLGASQDELCQARAHRQEGENSLLTALSNLDDMKLTNELLRDEIVDLKDDLQSCRESLNIEKEKHESRVASLSRELKSSSESFEAEKESFKSEWRHFQLLLKHLVDSIKGKCDVNESDQSSNSKDLPDIASQLGVLIQLVGKKEESILQLKSQIEGLEFDLRDARIVRDRLIHHDQKLEETASAEEDLETSRFLSEIEEAKVKVIGMDRRITTEKSKRKEVEKQLSVERKSLAMIHEELSQKVNNIEELEETVQLNQDEIERLQTQLGKNDEIQNKLERKYEETKSELESYCNLATELKQSIIQKVSFFAKVRWLTSIHFSLTSFSPLIQKNQDIENNESKIMELQFHVDDLQSQVEGWKASLEGLTSEADGWKVTLQNMNKDFEDGGSPNDTSVILSTSFDRNEELSSEIARLEEKMLAMDEEQRLQSSMHKSIVDGLEYRINVLSDESSEAQSYISSLEDSKARLQGKIDMLKKDCDVQCRRLTELESVLDIMKQQKSVSETLCDEVLSGLRKLTEVVIMYSSRLDGFSEELSSPSSWFVNLEYISRVIEFALKLNQKYSLDIQRLETTIDVQINSVGMPVIAEAITPKAKGSGCRSQESRIMPKHLSMIDEIKSMKDALKIVMASPRVTTPAKVTEKSNTDEEEGGDIYSDLLMAYDQLESLSTKLETYQEEQLQWREKETTLQSRIETLEKEKQELEFKAVDPSNAPDDDAKLKETTSEERLMKEKVFRNWALQTQKSKHLNIVKGMTRELNNTREKVQLLKSNLGMDETHQDS